MYEEQKRIFQETLDKRSFKQKMDDAWWTIKRKTKEGVDWCVAHPEISIPVITIAIPATVKITKSICGTISKGMEEHHRLCMAWDPRRGEYLQLRRPLKTSEQIKLDQLMTEGMSKTAALDLMGLLK